EMRPLRQGLEMVDRFAGLDLDDALQPMAALGRAEDEIRIDRGRRSADRRILLVPGVDRCLVLTPPLCLQQPDNPVVLELLADRPHQDRAQRRLPNDRKSKIKPLSLTRIHQALPRSNTSRLQ